jgi:hypothetical protein
MGAKPVFYRDNSDKIGAQQTGAGRNGRKTGAVLWITLNLPMNNPRSPPKIPQKPAFAGPFLWINLWILWITEEKGRFTAA